MITPTSLRIPGPLLARLDAQAKALGCSRNALLLRLIEEHVARLEREPPELPRVGLVELLGPCRDAPPLRLDDEAA